MKELLLVRHAKSSWDSPALNDFDRPLNDRGKRDAPMMAERLKGRKLKPDALISSTAVRALATARHFAKTFHIPEKSIILVPALYHAPVPVFYEVIEHYLQDAWQTVAIFSHNPGITDFVNDLGVVRVDNMPTCAVAGIRLHSNHWVDMATAEKSFWFFDYPKRLSA